MANVPVVNQGKTKFVKEYLAEHGDAKRAAINEAWRAAGHKDEISESLVYKMRSQNGLTARQDDTEEATRQDATSTSNVESLISEGKVEDGPGVEKIEVESNDKAPGKAAFVEDVLRRDPTANSKAVNRAWSQAGYEGTISDPTFYKVRGRLGAPGEPTGPTPAKGASKNKFATWSILLCFVLGTRFGSTEPREWPSQLSLFVDALSVFSRMSIRKRSFMPGSTCS